MAEGYIGEIRMFGGDFAPRSWAFCKGQLIAIKDNDALFALIGTIYGGDGRTTFALPDFRGRIPVHAGDSTGPGLPHWNLGQRAGSESHTLTEGEIPVHNHSLCVSDTEGTSGSPYETLYGKTTDTNKKFYKKYDAAQTGQFDSNVMGDTGGNQAHVNMMPSTGVSFIICMQGQYPPRPQ